MKLILRWLANVAAIVAAAYLLPRIAVSSIWAALVAGAVLGLLNTFIRPIFKLLALPITFLTLGLFVLVINGIILQILDWVMGEAFEISGFFWAIVGALIVSIVTSVINIALGTNKKRDRDRRR